MDYGLGPASVSIEGDVERGQEFVPRARMLLGSLLARMKIGGLEQGMDHWVLDEKDGSYCYAIVAGSVRKVIIVVGGVSGEADGGVPNVTAQIPDFVSGIVMNGTIPKQVTPPDVARLSTFWPTPHCADLFHLPDGVQQSAKLAVEPYSVFDELFSKAENSPVKYSQYTLLKPTMYSGLMRNVVQFLMGFGKQNTASIYDKAKPRIPDKHPPPVQRGNEDANLTQYEKDVKEKGRQIRFDWRWFRTHGIYRSSDKTLWIVEIGSSRGALAFRLPINAFTQDPRFREKLEKLGDDAGTYALDHLGAWPTGESIPTTAVDSWKRAGLVLELAPVSDLSDFYSNGPFSSQMGWAFSPDGSEAHNTCNGWDGDMQNASHYSISIQIGKFKEVDPPRRAQALKSKFSSLASKDGYKDRYPAVMAKIDRMEDRDCDSFVERTDPADSLFDEVDQLQLDPCASGSAHLSLVSRSPLYYPGKYQRMVKFPHPELGYLLSHDMRSSGPVADTRCNATVHVFFAQGGLKYVRYFRDPRDGPQNVHTDDFEECMYVGSWNSHDETGPRPIAPQMYTSEFDDRAEVAGSHTDAHITSVDMGYCQIGVQDDITYPPRAWVFRVKRFMKTTHSETVQGSFQTTAVTIPFYDRCAYYYTSAVGSTSSSSFDIAGYTYLSDPWFCETWRNFGGWTSGHAEHPDDCCICQARTVRSPAPRYNPQGYNGGAGNCADFADSGPFCFLCDNADAMVYYIPEPPLPPGQSTNEGPKVHRITHLVNDTDFAPLLIEDTTFTELNYERYWFIPSPDPDSQITQYLDVTHNAFGDAQAMKYYFQPNEGPIKTLGGPFPPSYNGQNITFLGVVP